MAEPTQDVDASLDEEMQNVTEEAKADEVDPVAPSLEAKMPTRKDTSLKEFLAKMDDYAPIVCSVLSPISAHMHSMLTWRYRFLML